MKKRRPTTPKPDGVRGRYEQLGVRGYYERFGGEYRNPHEPAVRAALGRAVAEWHLDLSHVLDLACGSGEVTLALRELGGGRTDGIDPYTAEAYLRRTGQPAETYTFEQIAAGALIGRAYSLLVCSFAMHLVPESRLPLLATQLAQIGPALLLITPHKRPLLRPAWGWAQQGELLVERVRARLYRRA